MHNGFRVLVGAGDGEQDLLLMAMGGAPGYGRTEVIELIGVRIGSEGSPAGAIGLLVHPLRPGSHAPRSPGRAARFTGTTNAIDHGAGSVVKGSDLDGIRPGREIADPGRVFLFSA